MFRIVAVIITTLLLAACAGGRTYMDDMFSPGLQKAMAASKNGNMDQAVILMKAEAEKGNGIAQSMVARIYGTLAEKDDAHKGDNLVEAYKWIELACNKGILYDKMPTDKAKDDAYRDQLAKKMTPEQIAKAQKLAAEWQPKGS